MLRTLLTCTVAFVGVVVRAVARVVVVLRVLARLVGDVVRTALAAVARLALHLAVLDLPPPPPAPLPLPLAAPDLPPPAAGLLAAGLDEGLEATQVGLGGPLMEAHARRELLD